jgi:tyrosyl-tRNA synthetase
LAGALRASDALFGGPLDGLTSEDFQDIIAEIPRHALDRPRLGGAGAPLSDLLVHAGLCPSKGQARKDIEGGGIYVNNQRAADITRTVGEADVLHGRYVLLRKGKRSYAVLQLA